jgi:exopolyphosphatase / guanosine-5'-triphosphate,3'-diphosphate pyrophosphatase
LCDELSLAWRLSGVKVRAVQVVMAQKTTMVKLKAPARPLAQRLTAIIDIGSNSVRLVVYRGLVRNPPVLFNEKVMCGLGRDLSDGSPLAPDAAELAVRTLKRFALLCEDMEVDHLDVVATAAVRSARDGQAFVDRVRATCGLVIRTISGEDEARLSAMGVMSAIPDADGVVGDLGGGSLELIRVSGGEHHKAVSLPIGSLTLLSRKDSSIEALEPLVRKAIEKAGWLKHCGGKPIYMVGGSWRALAHLHIHATSYPLPIIHGYHMEPDAGDRLVRLSRQLDRKRVKEIPNLTERRLPSLPIAALVLRELASRMNASALICSAYGLREGLLYSRLTPRIRALDPLIEACREEAVAEGRFPEHADALMTWLDPLFATAEPAGDRRLRLACCLLSDIAWRGHPDFRAERALDASLYGNWVGIDARGRAMIGVALYHCYGAELSGPINDLANRLLDKPSLTKAIAWGLALRLGQRLTAGTAKPLAGSSLVIDRGQLILRLSLEDRGLYGEVVERRLARLAEALNLLPMFAPALAA